MKLKKKKPETPTTPVTLPLLPFRSGGVGVPKLWGLWQGKPKARGSDRKIKSASDILVGLRLTSSGGSLVFKLCVSFGF